MSSRDEHQPEIGRFLRIFPTTRPPSASLKCLDKQTASSHSAPGPGGSCDTGMATCFVKTAVTAFSTASGQARSVCCCGEIRRWRPDKLGREAFK
jgi:hypothetical protein